MATRAAKFPCGSVMRFHEKTAPLLVSSLPSMAWTPTEPFDPSPRAEQPVRRPGRGQAVGALSRVAVSLATHGTRRRRGAVVGCRLAARCPRVRTPAPSSRAGRRPRRSGTRCRDPSRRGTRRRRRCRAATRRRVHRPRATHRRCRRLRRDRADGDAVVRGTCRQRCRAPVAVAVLLTGCAAGWRPPPAPGTGMPSNPTGAHCRRIPRGRLPHRARAGDAQRRAPPRRRSATSPAHSASIAKPTPSIRPTKPRP